MDRVDKFKLVELILEAERDQDLVGCEEQRNATKLQ